MSRHGYIDAFDDVWQLAMWRGQVMSAIRGKRGQRLLSEMVKALDAMPEKALIREELETPEGHVCALGAVGKARGIDMERIDPEDPYGVAIVFDVAPQLIREIAFLNDDEFRTETPEHRWTRMRSWAAAQVNSTVNSETPDGPSGPEGA